MFYCELYLNLEDSWIHELQFHELQFHELQFHELQFHELQFDLSVQAWMAAHLIWPSCARRIYFVILLLLPIVNTTSC